MPTQLDEQPQSEPLNGFDCGYKLANAYAIQFHLLGTDNLHESHVFQPAPARSDVRQSSSKPLLTINGSVLGSCSQCAPLLHSCGLRHGRRMLSSSSATTQASRQTRTSPHHTI